MRKIAFLFISILAIAFVIASPAMAQGPEPPFHREGSATGYITARPGTW